MIEITFWPEFVRALLCLEVVVSDFVMIPCPLPSDPIPVDHLSVHRREGVAPDGRVAEGHGAAAPHRTLLRRDRLRHADFPGKSGSAVKSSISVEERMFSNSVYLLAAPTGLSQENPLDHV